MICLRCFDPDVRLKIKDHFAQIPVMPKENTVSSNRTPHLDTIKLPFNSLTKKCTQKNDEFFE